MQDRALSLMGRKLTAAQALEGKFSGEGLVAMAGEDANVEIALARSLVNRMNEGDARRLWSKVSNSVSHERDQGSEKANAGSAVIMARGSRQRSLFDFLDVPGEVSTLLT